MNEVMLWLVGTLLPTSVVLVISALPLYARIKLVEEYESLDSHPVKNYWSLGSLVMLVWFTMVTIDSPFPDWRTSVCLSFFACLVVFAIAVLVVERREKTPSKGESRLNFAWALLFIYMGVAVPVNIVAHFMSIALNDPYWCVPSEVTKFF